MRTWALIALLVFAAPCAYAASGAGNVQVKNDLVTLEMKDAQMKAVLEELFEATGKSYTLTPRAKTLMEALKPTVQVRIQNARFDDALKAVLGDYGYSIENGIYTIMDPEYYHEDYLPRVKTSDLQVKTLPGGLTLSGSYSSGSPQAAQGTSVQPAIRGGASAPSNAPRPVTLDIPAMPVEEAIRIIAEKGNVPALLAWRFANGSGQTNMPGASFQDFPAEKAAEMVLLAAGFVPPGPNMTISTKAAPNLRFSLGSYPLALSSIPVVGAYRTGEGLWRVTMVAYLSSSDLAIASLLNAANVNYSMGDSATEGCAKTVTVRMVDVDLPEALQAVLEPLNLQYRKNGNVYIIQDKSTEASQPQPVSDFQPSK